MPSPEQQPVPSLTIQLDPAYGVVIAWPTTDGRLASAHLPPFQGRGFAALALALADDVKEGVQGLLRGYRTNAEIAVLAGRLVRSGAVDPAVQGHYFTEAKQRLLRAAGAMSPPADLAPLFEIKRRTGKRFARDDVRVVWHGRPPLD